MRLSCLPRAWREGVRRYARTGEGEREHEQIGHAAELFSARLARGRAALRAHRKRDEKACGASRASRAERESVPRCGRVSSREALEIANAKIRGWAVPCASHRRRRSCTRSTWRSWRDGCVVLCLGPCRAEGPGCLAVNLGRADAPSMGRQGHAWMCSARRAPGIEVRGATCERPPLTNSPEMAAVSEY